MPYLICNMIEIQSKIGYIKDVREFYVHISIFKNIYNTFFLWYGDDLHDFLKDKSM